MPLLYDIQQTVKSLLQRDTAISSSQYVIADYDYDPQKMLDVEIAQNPRGIIVGLEEMTMELNDFPFIQEMQFEGKVDVVESVLINREGTNYTSSRDMAEQVFGALQGVQLMMTGSGENNPMNLWKITPYAIRNNTFGNTAKATYTVNYRIKGMINHN